MSPSRKNDQKWQIAEEYFLYDVVDNKRSDKKAHPKNKLKMNMWKVNASGLLYFVSS